MTTISIGLLHSFSLYMFRYLISVLAFLHPNNDFKGEAAAAVTMTTRRREERRGIQQGGGKKEEEAFNKEDNATTATATNSGSVFVVGVTTDRPRLLRIGGVNHFSKSPQPAGWHRHSADWWVPTYAIAIEM